MKSPRLLAAAARGALLALALSCGGPPPVGDTDNDRVKDDRDNCLSTPNTFQEDRDGDGIGDACDNCRDAFNRDQTDQDKLANTPDPLAGGGAPDVTAGDACDEDFDGVAVSDDNCPLDFNPDQADANNAGSSARWPGDVCDADLDDVNDRGDNCLLAPNGDQADVDGDGAGDTCDPDDDGDGICDPGASHASCAGADNCPVVANLTQSDGDLDGIGDLCDSFRDLDADAVEDALDNCPAVTNTTQTDTDRDGLGDACDLDRDEDGVANAADNCPDVSNGSQGNVDGDLPGDACDPDLDGDGAPNGTDNCPRVSNAGQADGDMDGVGDACDSNSDGDGDGLDDAVDNCPGVSNANQRDTDGDGAGDACDLDQDGDGLATLADNCPLIANPTQVDGDGDGTGNACDNCRLAPNTGQADGDGDGTGDACDSCPAASNPGQADGDGDGTGDACDPAFDYGGFVMANLFRQDLQYETMQDAVYGGAIGGVPGWPRSYQWYRSTYFGFTTEEPPAASGNWELTDLLPPWSPQDFASINAGRALQLSIPGGPPPLSLRFDEGYYPGYRGYYDIPALPLSSWVPSSSYTLSIPGGQSLGPITQPGAVRTPATFTVSPDLVYRRISIFQSDFMDFTWTPDTSGQTRFLFKITSGDKVLQYVADDAQGRLRIPSTELSRLPSGPALLIFERQRLTPFPAGGRVWLGIGLVMQQGFANLIPRCDRDETEPNDADPNPLPDDELDEEYDACGVYGSRGDVDTFSFNAPAGRVVSARTYAAEAGSPIDTVLTLISPGGKEYLNGDASSATSDSALLRTLDETGTWKIKVSNAVPNRTGGAPYVYHLLVKVSEVSGIAYPFPGTQEGEAPQPGCFMIPDAPGAFVDGMPAVCTVEIAQTPATISAVNLAVEVAHTYPSDLRLELEHPDGTKVLLTNHTGRVRGIFDSDTRVDDRGTLKMDAFNGKDPNGLWKVRAVDWYAFDTGTIRSLTLFVQP